MMMSLPPSRLVAWRSPALASSSTKLPSTSKSFVSLNSEIYAWIGCNLTKFGHLYAAASTRPSNTVSVTSILGGSGSGIARRLVLRSGLNILLACNIPKNSPIFEANAEKKLKEKLISLGYMRPQP